MTSARTSNAMAAAAIATTPAATSRAEISLTGAGNSNNGRRAIDDSTADDSAASSCTTWGAYGRMTDLSSLSIDNLRLVRRLQRGTQGRRDRLRRFGRRVLRARPEEAAQSVLAIAGRDVHVEVRDALTHAVV